MGPIFENPDLVFQETGNCQSLTHSSWLNVVADKLSRLRPTIQTFHMISIRWLQPHIDLFATRFNNRLPQFMSPVPRLSSLGSGRTQSVLAGSGPRCLPTIGHSGQSGGKTKGLPVHVSHPNCSVVTQHSLALGAVDYVKPNPPGPAQPSQSADVTFQSDSTPESQCLAPRASALKEQGFSNSVA